MKKLLRCECCGKSLSSKQIAARVISSFKDIAWCFKCWDTDPRAVEQYRTEGLL